MTQSEIDFAVSRATGEAVDRIHRLGFSIADPVENFDRESFMRRPKYIDWDVVDSDRRVALTV